MNLHIMMDQTVTFHTYKGTEALSIPKCPLKNDENNIKLLHPHPHPHILITLFGTSCNGSQNSFHPQY